MHTTTLPTRQSPDRKIDDVPEDESWQHEFVSHWPEYASELVGTAFLLFCVVLVVAWMLADGSPIPQKLPSLPLRLFVTGLLLGGAGGVVALTPLGKLSGAHLNPAVSVGFWVLGKMHGHDVFGYIAAQCAGAIVGTWVGIQAAGQLAAGVRFAANQPGPRVSDPGAALGELAATGALALVVFISISHRRTLHWTPLFAILAVGVLVWLDANFSGASMNPARSLGPAIWAGLWSPYWVYVAGPVLGAAIAAAGHRWFGPAEAHTGKLFHSQHYRSVFKGDADRAANAHVREHHNQLPHERPRLRAPS